MNLHADLLVDIKDFIHTQLVSPDVPDSIVSNTHSMTEEVDRRLESIDITGMINQLESYHNQHVINMAEIGRGATATETHIDIISKVLSNEKNLDGSYLSSKKRKEGVSQRDKLNAAAETISDYEEIKSRITNSAYKNICYSLSNAENSIPYSIGNQAIANLDSLVTPADSKAKRRMDLKRYKLQRRQALIDAGVEPIDLDNEDETEIHKSPEDDKNAVKQEMKNTMNVIKIIFDILGQSYEDRNLLEKVTNTIKAYMKDKRNFKASGKKSEYNAFSEILKGWSRQIADIVGVISIINTNVTSILRGNMDKIRIYFTTLQSIARLRWFLNLGLSNCTSVDLSHLNAHMPLHLEDSTIMTMSHPILHSSFLKYSPPCLSKNNL